LFLAPYSPDLNPIEEAFSKVKGIVRKAGAMGLWRHLAGIYREVIASG
jgi:transposase